MPKTVRKMPQKPRLEQPKKVAAYARVSTGKDAMLHSLSSQVSYYSITTLKKQPLTVLEWNERLWITLLDTATVQRDGRIVFLFKSGKEIIK